MIKYAVNLIHCIRVSSPRLPSYSHLDYARCRHLKSLNTRVLGTSDLHNGILYFFWIGNLMKDELFF